MRPGRLLGAPLVMIAASTLVAACAASPGHEQAAGRSPSSVAVPSSIPNDPARRHDVTMTACGSAPGGWSTGGQIVNRSEQDLDYHLTVLFTSSEATVIGVGRTTVHVSAGGRRHWEMRSRFVPASPTLCVLAGAA